MMFVKPQTYPLTITHIDYSDSGNVIMMYCSIDDWGGISQDSTLFQAGQFMLLTVMIDGKIVKRSYSIATTPQLLQEQGIIGFSIKRVEGGVFSTRATQLAKAGDQLTMTGGLGRMVDDGSHTRYVLISAGSGLSPIYSIYHDLLIHRPGVKIANLFGERQYADMLDVVHRDWVSEVHQGVYSQCFLSQDTHHGYQQGRVQAGIEAALEWLGSDEYRVFLCGGPAMVDEVRDLLVQQYNCSPHAILFEKY